MRVPDEILIDNKIKAYRLIDLFYLTRCGNAYKLNKTWMLKKITLYLNNSLIRIFACLSKKIKI